MLRSSTICLLGALALTALTSAPAAAARVGCPCAPAHRHSVQPEHMHPRPVAVAHRRGASHVRRYYVRGHVRSWRRPFRYSDMGGGGNHLHNAGSLAWRYWGY